MGRLIVGVVTALLLLAAAGWLLHMFLGGLVLVAVVVMLAAASWLRGSHPLGAAVCGILAGAVLLRLVLGFWFGLWPWVLVALGIWGLSRLGGGVLPPRRMPPGR